MPLSKDTGDVRLAVCHPSSDSDVNLTVARSVPEPDHTLPTWGPKFSGDFQNRMPVTLPSTFAWKRVPNSTLRVSLSTTACSGISVPQMVTGVSAAALAGEEDRPIPPTRSA